MCQNCINLGMQVAEMVNKILDRAYNDDSWIVHRMVTLPHSITKEDRVRLLEMSDDRMVRFVKGEANGKIRNQTN